MPWRKAGVTHPNNEIYIDIVEEIDAILSVNGAVISSDVSGSIQAQSNLSGVPDLLLTFNDPTLIDSCSFHPCVRYTRFEKDRVVSFVPPVREERKVLLLYIIVYSFLHTDMCGR